MGTSLREFAAGEIRAEMARQKRTGVELAQLLKCSQQSVSRRLSAETSIDLDELAQIADWLGVDIRQFFASEVLAS